MSVTERLRQVQARIALAAERAGRSPPRLVAVSKTKPAAVVREAYAAGQRDFGENYAQELCGKAAELADLVDLRWHMIGHLQRNKVKSVAGVASALHAVDSLRLVEELARRATPLPEARRFDVAGRAPDARWVVLVEVNVSGEPQKSGCPPGELAALLDAVASQPSLALSGLMTMPPHSEDPGHSRPFFDLLAALRDQHGGAQRLPELSMGMTHDLESAIAAGASLVRVGTAIFGERG